MKRLRHTLATKVEVEKAAKAILDELKHGDDTLTIKLPGDPSAAGGQIIAMDLRSGVAGQWSVTSTRHEISGGGYTTSIKSKSPKNEAG